MRRINYKYGDFLGSVFFIEELEQVGRDRFAMFKCKCGNKFKARLQDIRAGKTTSCGCYQKERASESSRIHGDAKSHYLYGVWSDIKKRCYNKNNHAYKNYGGRGISMLTKWKYNYVLFKLWIIENLGERPDGYTLDRIDNNGNYEPDNLRWASRADQNRNKRNPKLQSEDVLEIRWLLSLNIPRKEIASEYSVCVQSIDNIATNKSHKNVKS